jgi:predicted phage terminase large subunit-like protein
MGGPGSGSGNKPPIHDALEINRALMSRSFRDYIPEAFEVLESGEAYAEGVRRGLYKPRFTNGWHIAALAEHLQAVSDGEIRRLLVNIPPGTMKSVLACVLWPTWMWGRTTKDPAGTPSYIEAAKRFLFSSYSEEFTKRDTRRSKALMQSTWYRERFPHVVLKSSPDTVLEHHNTLGGERHGGSTNSGVTGKHVHGVVEDDPIKAQDAQSERARKEAWFYHTEVLSSRLLPEAGWRVVIMQRLHEDDVSGRILAHADGSDGDYIHLNLPMELELKRKCVVYLKPESERTPSTKPFFVDPRKHEGELLWPQRMNEQFAKDKKSPQGLGQYGYAGQYQQRPAPAGGAIIQRDWIRYYMQLPVPAEQMQQEQSWDLIFDDDGEGSFVVGQVWGRYGSNHYLLHQYRKRIDFVETLRAFILTTKAYPNATKKKVEKKANGAALIAVLRDKIVGIVPVKPRDSKGSRMMAVSPLFEAGNVYLPAKEICPWVEGVVEEIVGMTPEGPSTANDDQADACTQYLSDKGFTSQTAGFTIDLNVGTRPSPYAGFGGAIPNPFPKL